MPVLRESLSADELGRVQRWWEVLHQDGRMVPHEVRVCHHDLWHGNLLIDDTQGLSGVLDWAHVEIGDPAHDFAAPRYFGERFFGWVVNAYVANGGSFGAEERHRAQAYWEGREFGGIAWAIEHDDDTELAEGIRKLRSGPVFMASGSS